MIEYSKQSSLQSYRRNIRNGVKDCTQNKEQANCFSEQQISSGISQKQAQLCYLSIHSNMSPVINVITRNQSLICPLVPFDAARDKVVRLDLTSNNKDLTEEIVTDTIAFSTYIDTVRSVKGARYLFGGYNEHRMVYSRSELFLSGTDGIDEPRCIHLGVDIWGPAGTPVFAPLGGMVHSFAFNDHFGDYGATIILSHQLEGVSFYTLYGHLSLADLSMLSEGQYISAGSPLAHFGVPKENGHWPPHLHFQVITDIGVSKGDYPGVCRVSEREKYLANSPDPSMLINFNDH